MTPTCRTVIASAFAAGTPAGPTSAGMTALRVGWLTAANPDTHAVSTHSSARLPPPGSSAWTASSALVTAAPDRRDQHQPAPVHRVGDRAAEQPEDDQRHQRHDRGDADQQRRAGQRVDLERDGDQRHLLAEHRGRDAPEQPPEVRVAQRRGVDRPAAPARRRHRLLDRPRRPRPGRPASAHGASRCTIQPPPSSSSRTNRSRSCSRSWPPCQNSTVSGHDPVAAPDRRPRHRPGRASARRAAAPARRAPSRESTTVDCTDATAASCAPRGRGSQSASEAASPIRSTRPVTRTWRCIACQGKTSAARGLTASCAPFAEA